MFCSKCGKENNVGANFCRKCGQKLGKDQINNQQQHKLNKDKKPVIIVAIIVIAIFAGVLLNSVGVFDKKLVHVCDECGKTFTGTAYYDSFDYDTTMCKECAVEYYAPFPIHGWEK